MYYLILVQNDSTPAIFGYSSRDEVLARYHTELAYRAEGLISTRCMILDSNLNVTEKDQWIASAANE